MPALLSNCVSRRPSLSCLLLSGKGRQCAASPRRLVQPDVLLRGASEGSVCRPLYSKCTLLRPTFGNRRHPLVAIHSRTEPTCTHPHCLWGGGKVTQGIIQDHREGGGPTRIQGERSQSQRNRVSQGDTSGIQETSVRSGRPGTQLTKRVDRGRKRPRGTQGDAGNPTNSEDSMGLLDAP